jgi:hypothetical protein
MNDMAMGRIPGLFCSSASWTRRRQRPKIPRTVQYLHALQDIVHPSRVGGAVMPMAEPGIKIKGNSAQLRNDQPIHRRTLSFSPNITKKSAMR